MEHPVLITWLNDFIFCPASIYFHNLYGEPERMAFQEESQINGTFAHKNIDEARYSDRAEVLCGTDVFCEEYGLIGKIDIFNTKTGELAERKKRIKTVYAVLNCYGFDTYCGVMHRNFYMRKSLVCDIVEPFRVLIDEQIRKAISLKRCKTEDFMIDRGRYVLKWEKNAEYIAWMAEPIMEHKTEIHAYVQAYYRAFMKQRPADDFPLFEL